MSDDVLIRGPTIRLGQLLKFVGVTESGAQVKALLGAGEVAVNGESERRRGRQLRSGDVVQVGDRELRVVAASGSVSRRG